MYMYMYVHVHHEYMHILSQLSSGPLVTSHVESRELSSGFPVVERTTPDLTCRITGVVEWTTRDLTCRITGAAPPHCRWLYLPTHIQNTKAILRPLCSQLQRVPSQPELSGY